MILTCPELAVNAVIRTRRAEAQRMIVAAGRCVPGGGSLRALIMRRVGAMLLASGVPGVTGATSAAGWDCEEK